MAPSDGKRVPMLYTRMNVAGNGFEPERNVIRTRYGLDGGGSVAADVDGNVWVAWHAPEKGGGAEKVIENYERGVAICSQLKPPADKLEPSWGEPELLMSLAYANMTRNPPDLNKAEQHARAALEIVPYWHYVRDILMSQIMEAKAKAKQTSPTS